MSLLPGCCSAARGTSEQNCFTFSGGFDRFFTFADSIRAGRLYTLRKPLQTTKAVATLPLSAYSLHHGISFRLRAGDRRTTSLISSRTWHSAFTAPKHLMLGLVVPAARLVCAGLGPLSPRGAQFHRTLILRSPRRGTRLCRAGSLSPRSMPPRLQSAFRSLLPTAFVPRALCQRRRSDRRLLRKGTAVSVRLDCYGRRRRSGSMREMLVRQSVACRPSGE